MFDLKIVRSDVQPRRGWLDRYQTLVGSFAGLLGIGITLSVTISAQHWTNEQERAQQTKSLSCLLLAELMFDRDQIDSIRSSFDRSKTMPVAGFILLPGDRVFEANLSRLDLLTSDEAERTYSAISYYDLTRDQLAASADFKSGDVWVFKDRSKASSFLAPVSSATRVIQEGIDDFRGLNCLLANRLR